MTSVLPLFLGNFGIWEILLILLVVLLIFGGRKIPELMRGLGRGVKEFKNASKEDDKEGESGKTDKTSGEKPKK
ncbi:twin-arginine translocase TatA/TatE family subunit [uncultured Alistipes sp.]|jgi:twin arginine-targeting protein translocase, tatA/E family|uniref:twin-arginine translocase TatA/TatE family subunit n=1 Tax=uncultured Alistipes sp. TaxID=538949 RepID=UPI0025CD63D6|nr:twin-arginine translocase TatA/TatE family subunit [uncultured Alistipes sp.]